MKRWGCGAGVVTAPAEAQGHLSLKQPCLAWCLTDMVCDTWARMVSPGGGALGEGRAAWESPGSSALTCLGRSSELRGSVRKMGWEPWAGV